MECQAKGQKIEVEIGVRHRAICTHFEGLKNIISPGQDSTPADLFN